MLVCECGFRNDVMFYYSKDIFVNMLFEFSKFRNSGGSDTYVLSIDREGTVAETRFLLTNMTKPFNRCTVQI